MKNAEVLLDGEWKGNIALTEEEANHFSHARNTAAKCAMVKSDLDRLGIDEDDYVEIIVKH